MICFKLLFDSHCCFSTKKSNGLARVLNLRSRYEKLTASFKKRVHALDDGSNENNNKNNKENKIKSKMTTFNITIECKSEAVTLCLKNQALVLIRILFKPDKEAIRSYILFHERKIRWIYCCIKQSIPLTNTTRLNIVPLFSLQ